MQLCFLLLYGNRIVVRIHLDNVPSLNQRDWVLIALVNCWNRSAVKLAGEYGAGC